MYNVSFHDCTFCLNKVYLSYDDRNTDSKTQYQNTLGDLQCALNDADSSKLISLGKAYYIKSAREAASTEEN